MYSVYIYILNVYIYIYIHYTYYIDIYTIYLYINTISIYLSNLSIYIHTYIHIPLYPHFIYHPFLVSRWRCCFGGLHIVPAVSRSRLGSFCRSSTAQRNCERFASSKRSFLAEAIWTPTNMEKHCFFTVHEMYIMCVCIHILYYVYIYITCT
jgi:hypothetical protein